MSLCLSVCHSVSVSLSVSPLSQPSLIQFVVGVSRQAHVPCYRRLLLIPGGKGGLLIVAGGKGELPLSLGGRREITEAGTENQSAVPWCGERPCEGNWGEIAEDEGNYQHRCRLPAGSLPAPFASPPPPRPPLLLHPHQSTPKPFKKAATAAEVVLSFSGGRNHFSEGLAVYPKRERP